MCWQLCIRGGVKAKVKVVTVHISFSLVNQFDWFISAVLSSSLSHWDLARFKGSKMKWRRGLLQFDPGLRGWESNLVTQDCLVTREYLHWIWTWLYHVTILFIGIVVLNWQQFCSGKVVAALAWHHRGRGWELYRRQRSGIALGNLHPSMELHKWKVSFVMDNGMKQWCSC